MRSKYVYSRVKLGGKMLERPTFAVIASTFILQFSKIFESFQKISVLWKKKKKSPHFDFLPTIQNFRYSWWYLQLELVLNLLPDLKKKIWSFTWCSVKTHIKVPEHPWSLNDLIYTHLVLTELYIIILSHGEQVAHNFVTCVYQISIPKVCSPRENSLLCF